MTDLELRLDLTHLAREESQRTFAESLEKVLEQKSVGALAVIEKQVCLERLCFERVQAQVRFAEIPGLVQEQYFGL